MATVSARSPSTSTGQLPTTLASLFAHAPARVTLEIGFGGGEHLVAAALADPAAGFIGVEPFSMAWRAPSPPSTTPGLGNVRLFDGDAARLLDWLPPASLVAVDLLYPDPWPKKRHWKRRFVSVREPRSAGPRAEARRRLPLRQRHPLLCRMDARPRAPPSGLRLDRRTRRRLAEALSRLAGHALRGQGAARRAARRPI